MGVEASIAVNRSFKIPKSLAKGRYYIGMIVDTANSVIEFNEANNVRYKTTMMTIS